MSFGRPGGPEKAKRAGNNGNNGISADTQQLIDGVWGFPYQRMAGFASVVC